MFAVPFVVSVEWLSYGSIGTEVRDLCPICGFVIFIEVSSLNLDHDCAVCTSLIERFGTCEYMHQANPGVCRCRFWAKREKTSRQTVLPTPGADRARVRYWLKWSLNEGVKLGLTVPLEERTPKSSQIAHKDEQ